MSKYTQIQNIRQFFCTTQLLLDISNLPFFQSNALTLTALNANIGKTLDRFTILYSSFQHDLTRTSLLNSELGCQEVFHRRNEISSLLIIRQTRMQFYELHICEV